MSTDLLFAFRVEHKGTLPPIKVAHPHVDRDAITGSPIVKGSHVFVRRLFSWHRSGTAVATLVKRYPSLGWAAILDALAFAYDNPELITADLAREREAMAASLKPQEGH